MTGTRTRDVRGRTRHGVTGAMLATLMLAGQAGAQVAGCNWTGFAFWDGAALPDVERCIAAGADVNARSPLGETPLHRAAGSRGTAEAVQALIDAGAEIDARDGLIGGTPLHWAAASGTSASMEALIAAGAEIEAWDFLEQTPLHWAAQGGTAETVQALIDAGADIGARTSNGELAADLALDNEAVRNHDVFLTLIPAWFD